MKKFILGLIAVFGLTALAAYAATNNNIVIDHGLYEVKTPKGTVVIQPYSPEIFRITVFPPGEPVKMPQSPFAMIHPNKVGVCTNMTNSAFFVCSQTTTVRVDLATGNITFSDDKGNAFLEELNGVDNRGPIKTVTFQGTRYENIYGAGERGHKLNLNQRDTLTMYNRQNYGYTEGDKRISQMGISVPYFVSEASFAGSTSSDYTYAVLFDDYSKGSLVLGDTITYTSESPTPISYFFFNGNKNIANATEKFTELVGRQSLPPFWALGYITSKYGYHNQNEAVGAIDSLKTRGYPVDGMVLDLYWYGQETDMGRLEWDPKQWPDHKKMLADLKAQGVNTVLITQPYINKIGAIDNYNMLSSKGMLTKDAYGNTHDVTTWVGEAGMFDMSNPETAKWLWNRLKDLTEEGVAGWWGDLGEPEVHPETIYHANGETATQFHNRYGNEWSKIIYDGLRKDFPDMRPMLMMRGGTTGLQKYSVFPWTTDVSRSWGGFQPQIKLMLSSGLSGLGYMSSDLGGFAVDPQNPTDEELYVRWVQMGAFTPTMRTHAQLKPEPYHYPASEEILKEYIKMRYKWLPYNYTLAYENATKGWPLARPLNFMGDNPGFYYSWYADEYLWGNNVLVAPVMEKGATERRVLFPAGTWISWYDASKKYEGGATDTVAAPLHELPLFVRQGSFIPQYDLPIENVTQYDPTFLTVRYYPSYTPTEYTLYDDNKMSPTALEDKAYQLINFLGQKEAGEIKVSLTTNGGKYPGMPQSRMITLKLMDVDRPVKVALSDNSRMEEFDSEKAIRQYGWNYDSATRTLILKFAWNYKPLTVTTSLY
ncbi:MAG: DUF5110 domain-containing protein [Muribaculaceae bacterium]|nr:DUF5110 domain-containing protein [Muribaculaceae bacterium]